MSKNIDPAAGSGNFLTETYLCLRRLENEVISLETGGQISIGEAINPIKVSISQFYGIEINDFAVTVAKTALWIAESQMMKETEDIVHMTLDFLPLKTNATIIEGNALRLNWGSVVPKTELSYLMGNPPFVGHQYRSESQAEDMDIVFRKSKNHGKLDYVACWYKKAAELMQGTAIECAFVSTNSITQGESVAILWSPLFTEHNLEIQYAYRTFYWDSEATQKAHVHCVIIGFTCYHSDIQKTIFDGGKQSLVDHINGYLIGAPDLFIQSRGNPLNPNMPSMSKGSQPTDGGNLLLSTEEREELIAHYPDAAAFIKRYMGSEEFINNKYRYCLWLKGIAPSEYRSITPIMERLQEVAEVRSKSPTASVRKDAEKPMLFTQIRQPESNYLAVPEVSSQRRKYIPIGYMTPETIASSKLYLIPDASIYMFGVMMSNVHMAWMRVVCGRLKSDYSYSPAVYNNFPWPNPTETQKEKIEQTAQSILDARALYPSSSLADLYDELTMPPELRTAHQRNDRAVMEAYGFWGKLNSESECVAELMKMYQALTTSQA
ncbi:MAG: class I SAM-dependent DNA methyltransferase [Ruminococcus sp.]|nr:class I SAM-dependent DNA methyltransferase [Ruminococcus sp.]